MAELNELYQELVLDHYEKPRNFRKIPAANRSAEGFNPLCGDQVTVELVVDGSRIQDVGFQGSGCAISRASASMMTGAVKGKSVEEARALLERFRDLVTTGDGGKDGPELGRLAAFRGVSRFPVRVKCAVLPWHTLKAALDQKQGVVSTEEEAPGVAAAAGPSGEREPAAIEQDVIEALRTCYDPEIPVDVYELGLIYSVRVEPAGKVHVRMTLTSPSCPVAEALPVEVEQKVASIPGVSEADVELVWDPPWDPSMMSEAARLELGFI